MRLASGIAPIKELRSAGVNVGLGVDGSASNDGSHMLAEARQALLLSRLKEGITGFSLSNDPARKLMTAREALELATLGGAAVLGRSDIGSLEVGKCADLAAVRLDKLAYAGALHDPLAALVFCAPQNVDWNIVHGQVVVENSHHALLDIPNLAERHNRSAQRILNG